MEVYFYSVNYNEGGDNTYQSVTVNDKTFDSGNFIVDWFEATKHGLMDANEKDVPFLKTSSSSVDHFISDTELYDECYLNFDDGQPYMYYPDRTLEGWFNDPRLDGIELFVPKGEKWGWDKLKNYCKDEKLS